MTHRITLVPGDGIGPEVTNAVVRILEAAGSGLDRVTKTTVFLTDLAEFAAMNEVYSTYFPKDPPARTTVVVPQPLANPDGLIEISAVVIPFERTVGEIGREQSLPDAANCSRAQHCRDARHDKIDIYAATLRDFLERLAHEALDLVLRNRENLGVDGIVVLDWQHGN